MPKAATFSLPYEPNHTGHRSEHERRERVKAWLRKREQRLRFNVSPSIAPDIADAEERIRAWSSSHFGYPT